MSEVILSEAEKMHLVYGIQDNFRIDGRECENYRYMEVETNLISNEAGSARLRLANTDVLVGVKAEIGRPLVDRPDEGRIEFFLDCSANASPVFEGRGGEALATTIVTTLKAAFGFDQCLDLKSLCLMPRETCWILYVDILLLECGGNLFDAVSIAVKAALHNTRIPKVIIGSGEQGAVELEIPDDPFDCLRLNTANIPCLVTVSKVGHSYIVDASIEEETCCLASLVFGIREDGVITAMKKFGSTSLDPASVHEMMEMGRRVGQAIHKSLGSGLKEEEKRNEHLMFEGRREQQVEGFLR